MASGGYHNITEIDLIDDDEEEEDEAVEEVKGVKEEDNATGDWEVVQNKRGKKGTQKRGKQGTHKFSENDEIVLRTGQKSWFSQTSEEPLFNGTMGAAGNSVTKPTSQMITNSHILKGTSAVSTEPEKMENQVKHVVPTQNLKPDQEIIQRTGQLSWFDDSNEEFAVEGFTQSVIETKALPVSHSPVLPNVWQTSRGQQQNNSQHLTPLQNGALLPQKNLSHLTNGLPSGVPKEPLYQSIRINGSKLSSLDDWLQAYTFRLACQGCFTQNTGMHGKKAFRLNQRSDHVCTKNLLLCLLNNADSPTPIWGLIRPRTNLSFQGIYKLCYHYQSDRPCTTGSQNCHFAHGMEEKTIWEAERDGSLDRKALMDHLSKKNVNNVKRAPIVSIQNPHPPAVNSMSSVVVGGVTYAGVSSSRAVDSSASQMFGTNHSLETSTVTANSLDSPGKIPSFDCLLRVVCKPCFDRGENIESREKFNYCSVPNDHKGEALIYLLKQRSGFWTKVRARPLQLHPLAVPVMCKWAPNCKHEEISGVACRYPHCQEEIELWNYQLKYGLKTIEEVLEVSRNRRATPMPPCPVPNHTTGAASAKPPVPNHVTVAASAKPPVPVAAPGEQTWKYREPPHLPSGNYRRCKYDVFDRCRYSKIDDRFNFCSFAHSDEELEEWKLRHPSKFRENIVKRNNLLPAPPLSSANQNMDHVTGISDTIELLPQSGLTPSDLKKLTVYLPISSNPQKAFYSYHWNLKVHGSKLDELETLGLISDNSARRHFILKEPQSDTDPVFSVVFMSTVPGFFQQKLQYNFRNGLSRTLTLTVSIGTATPLPRVDIQPRESQVDHVSWNTSNSCIVPYSISNDLDPFYEKLIEFYPPSTTKVVFQLRENLTKENYKQYFHKMIHLEEEACNEKIARFGGDAEISLTNEITDGVYLTAQGGELFGKLQISGGLLDNSDASQIVSRMSKFILLKFKPTSKTVFQTKIVTNGIDLQQDDTVYVSIGKICVLTEGLKAGTKVKVQMQFEVDRTWFCSMHYGVDHVNVPELVFPPHALQKRFPGVRKEECKDMNPKQEDAARYILGANRDQLFHPGPTLIIGPFGTGKTHALAKIVMRLLLTSRDSKILIATHTNSAADWYITEYLDDFLMKLKRNNTSFLLRVYAAFVDYWKVDETIKNNYSLMSNGQEKFRNPTLNDVANCRVVVTTLTASIHLVDIPQLRGHFTHIFIDEAGQALETETMIPLGLAGPRTVVVLAGDHKQMRPKVYSKEGQNRLFGRSMIERLSIWNRIQKCGNTCFLTFNYRMRPEILEFVSNIYEGTMLDPKGNHERHPDFYPISFGVVEGMDEQRGSSYVNGVEAGVVVAQIKLLIDIWPTNVWGEFKEKDIAVLTPYTQQVKHIRSLLRREKLREITVERVQNVQGKQFKVVFVSPVRTRNTLQANLTPLTGPNDQSSLPKEGHYYGFLSDEGELITAFTRSQCLLFVIGDPVALCGVGECQKIWKRYISECEKHTSLFPEGTTLKDIMIQVYSSNSGAGEYTQHSEDSYIWG